MDEPIELKFINPRNESFAIGSNFTLISGLDFDTYECKPYLFPMSSMTAEHVRKFYCIKGLNLSSEELIRFKSNQLAVVSNITTYNWSIDWLNAHHYDYRGLIPKGLAIDATDKNIY